MIDREELESILDDAAAEGDHAGLRRMAKKYDKKATREVALAMETRAVGIKERLAGRIDKASRAEAESDKWARKWGIRLAKRPGGLAALARKGGGNALTRALKNGK